MNSNLHYKSDEFSASGIFKIKDMSSRPRHTAYNTSELVLPLYARGLLILAKLKPSIVAGC